MQVIVLGKRYEFPGQISQHDKKLWELKSILDKFYDGEAHHKSIQLLWDMLNQMMYFTPSGHDGRSLEMIGVEQITELIDVMNEYRANLGHVSQSIFPRCQRRYARGNIILNPLGFVCFDPDVRGIRIID